MSNETESGGEYMGSRDFFRGGNFIEGQDKLVHNETDLLTVAKTEKTGRGLVAKKQIRKGERIFGIYGTEEIIDQNSEERYFRPSSGEHTWPSVTDNPDFYEPNSVSINQETTPDGRVLNTLLDPHKDNPLRFLNHSCNPNSVRLGAYTICALRDIAKGEPITIDYSTFEINPKWRMECQCGAPHCRREIRSVQSLTPQQIEPSWHTLPSFIKRIYVASAGKQSFDQEDLEVFSRLKEDMGTIGF